MFTVYINFLVTNTIVPLLVILAHILQGRKDGRYGLPHFYLNAADQLQRRRMVLTRAAGEQKL